MSKAKKSIAKAVPDGGGLRLNSNKNMLELLPAEWIWGLATVTTKGTRKYSPRNWERGMAWSIMIGCAFRHTLKFMCGERYDSETGCHHLFMAAWNLCALASYDIREIGENDLVGHVDWLRKCMADGEFIDKEGNPNEET